MGRHASRANNKAPRPGTKLRRLYDRLVAAPNQPVAFTREEVFEYAITRLREDYDLDVRAEGQGRGQHVWRYVP